MESPIDITSTEISLEIDSAAEQSGLIPWAGNKAPRPILDASRHLVIWTDAKCNAVNKYGSASLFSIFYTNSLPFVIHQYVLS